MTPVLDTSKAPRIWRTVGPGMRVRVIDPKWLSRVYEPNRVRAEACYRFAEKWATERRRERAHKRHIREVEAIARQSRSGISFELIAYRICRAMGLSKIDLLSKSRNRRLVLARQAVMYWCQRRTIMSLPAIGKRLGGLDHTTVLHGIRRYPELRAKQGRHLKSLAGPSKTMRQQERGA